VPADLAELRRLHEAATPEHQIFAVGPDGDELATDLVSGDCVYGPMICTFDTPDIWADQGDWSREKMDAYARLIAAACNALPELLDEIERLSRQWTCFHCGFQTGDRNEAAAHFGEMGEEEPLCLTWKELDEHGKASELQNALGQLAEANAEIERLRLALSQIAYLKVPVKKIAREALGK